MVYFDDASITRLTDDLGKSFRDRDSPGWSMSTCYVIHFADFFLVVPLLSNACLLDVHVSCSHVVMLSCSHVVMQLNKLINFFIMKNVCIVT